MTHLSGAAACLCSDSVLVCVLNQCLSLNSLALYLFEQHRTPGRGKT